MYQFRDLPVSEYINAIIIIQLSIKLPLLAAWHISFACPKEVWRKRQPTMPALRAPLCCSPVAGRQKLADTQTGLAPYSATSSAARRHQTGAANMRVTVSCRRFPNEPHLEWDGKKRILFPKKGITVFTRLFPFLRYGYLRQLVRHYDGTVALGIADIEQQEFNIIFIFYQFPVG
jgi:hypothetical protein